MKLGFEGRVVSAIAVLLYPRGTKAAIDDT